MRNTYSSAGPTSVVLLLLTGDPVKTWLSVTALIMPGRRAMLGRSNGLAPPCVDPGILSLCLLPGVATGSTGTAEGKGCARGSVKNIVSSFSTTSRKRSGCACNGFVAI